MWTSIASKPASRSTPAPCAYCSTIVAISSVLTARVRRMPSGLKTREGATAGDFVPIGFATGPA